ncbi:MAG TPA: hypothetical protein VGK97_06235 [Spongiibacteraceae bacterium]|jgi:hypothetical protein
MKIKNTFLPAMAGLSLAVSAHADLIQVSFAGTVNAAYDIGSTSVFSALPNVGDTVTGALIFDATIAGGLPHTTDAIYEDSAHQINWVSGSLTFQGSTYTVDPVSGYAINNSFDLATISGSPSNSIASLYDNEFGQTYSSTVYSFRGNFLGIQVVNATVFGGDFSLSNFESVLASPGSNSNFSFTTYRYSGISPDGNYSYIGSYLTNAALAGTLDSVTVTNIGQQPSSVPIPSTFILMASGMSCLGFMRRLRSVDCRLFD